MQALERAFFSQDWITFVLFFLLLILFVLKGLSVERLQRNFSAIFNRGLVEIEIEERLSIFNPFQIVQFIFSVGVVATFVFLVVNDVRNHALSLNQYGLVVLFTLCYFLGKKGLEIALVYVFKVQELVNYYRKAKSIYLYSISYYLFFLLIVFCYAPVTKNVSFFILSLLLVLRIILLFVSNKNLIFNHLFYFILYLCAFEIAPLLILFKLML